MSDLNLNEKIKSVRLRCERKERYILDAAYGLTVMLEDLNELDPVYAGNTYKQVIQYLQEKNVTKTVFTIAELEDMGYIIKA